VLITCLAIGLRYTLNRFYDRYELPMFIKNISDDYEIIYRKYASTTRNRFTNAELVMYAVPKNRLKNPV